MPLLFHLTKLLLCRLSPLVPQLPSDLIRGPGTQSQRLVSVRELNNVWIVVTGWGEDGRVTGPETVGMQRPVSHEVIQAGALWGEEKYFERTLKLRDRIFFMIPGSSPSKQNVPELSGYRVPLCKSQVWFLTLQPLSCYLSPLGFSSVNLFHFSVSTCHSQKMSILHVLMSG